VLYRIFFVSIIILSIYLSAHGEEKTVKIATLEDYAPFCIKTREKVINNQIISPGNDAAGFKGYCWDVLKESFHEMGYTINLTVSPWARAMMNLKSGNADILFPTGKNSERQKIFYYSEESTNEAKFVVYIQTASKIKWKGLNGLKGLTIGFKRKFNYGDKWEKTTVPIKYGVATIAQGFEMLDANRLDGFLGYEYNWDYFLNQENSKAKYKKLPAFDSTSEYLVALKKNPNGKLLLKIFDIGKKQLVKNGKFAAIKAKWLGY